MFIDKIMFRLQLTKTVACPTCIVKMDSNGLLYHANYSRKLQNGLSASVLLTHIISLVRILLHVYSATCQHCRKEFYSKTVFLFQVMATIFA